jgi:hypothetical protein
MTRSLLLFAFLLPCLTVPAISEEASQSLGPRDHVEILPVPDSEQVCPVSSLRKNDDNSFENGYAWSHGGVLPPDYGAFAEGFDAGFVCGLEFLLTQAGNYTGQTMDVFIWEDDGVAPPDNNPGNVICMVPGVDPGAPSWWPEVSAHQVQVCCPAGGSHFVGFWGRWPEDLHAWYIASDEDGPGGSPRTKISPDAGGELPTGWHHANVVWEDCKALGIRELAYDGDCIVSGVPDPEPGYRSRTWGAIKALY